MESAECRLARLIVERFVKDLLARKGFRQMLEEEISPELRKEIEHGWYEKTLAIVLAEASAAA